MIKNVMFFFVVASVVNAPSAVAQGINNWSQFQAWCANQGGVAAKASGGSGPKCTPLSAAPGGGGLTSLQQQQLNMAGQLGSMLGQALGESLRGNPAAEAQRLADQENARLQAEHARLERERKQDEARARLLAMSKGLEGSTALQFKWDGGGSAASATLASSGIPFKLDGPAVPARDPGVPLTAFSQGVASADSGLAFKFDDTRPNSGGNAAEQLLSAAGRGVAAPDAPRGSFERYRRSKEYLEDLRAQQKELKKTLENLKKDQAPTPEKQAEIQAKTEELAKVEKDEKEFVDASLDSLAPEAVGASPGAAPSAASVSPAPQ